CGLRLDDTGLGERSADRRARSALRNLNLDLAFARTGEVLRDGLLREESRNRLRHEQSRRSYQRDRDDDDDGGADPARAATTTRYRIVPALGARRVVGSGCRCPPLGGRLL